MGCRLWGCTESDMTEQLHFDFSLSCFGEGNGNPLQRSCLENPRDGGAWWAAVYGVAQSWTRLKQLSSSSSSSTYGSEIWTVKKTERWRIDAFEPWCWRRLLRVPWTARRSNQSILKEISPGISLEEWCWSWNSSTLASCEELTHWKRLWGWEGLGAGGEGDDRGWDGWMASLTRWMWVSVNSRSWWWTGRPGVLRFMGSHRARHD